MAGPASTSNPSNEGALKVSPSGLAFRANSTRNASPTATVSGELASKVTFSAADAEKIASTKSAVRDIFATKSLITKQYVCQFAPHPVPAGRCRHRRLPIRLRTAKSRNQGAAPGPPGYGPGSTHPLPKAVSQTATGRGLSRRDRNFARIICRISYLTTVFFTILQRKVLRVSIFSCN